MNLLLGQGDQIGGQALSELRFMAAEHPLFAPQGLAAKRPLPSEQATMGHFRQHPRATHDNPFLGSAEAGCR
jgi:hypothetical protein